MKIVQMSGKKFRGIWTVRVSGQGKSALGSAETLPKAVRAATAALVFKKKRKSQ